MFDRRWLVCALLAILCTPALADDLRLGANQFLEWNRATSPAASPTLTIPIFNDFPGTDRISGWTISLAVRPLPQSSGSLALDPAAFAYPANSVINGPRFPLEPTEPVPALVLVNGGDEEFFNTLNPAAIETIPAVGRGLLDLRFASTDALGAFELVAVNDAAGFYTNWTDADFTNRAFNNAPFAANTVLRLATINVVPEPSAAALFTVAFVTLFGAFGLSHRQS